MHEIVLQYHSRTGVRTLFFYIVIDSKEIYNVTKYVYFKPSEIRNHSFNKNIKQ